MKDHASSDGDAALHALRPIVVDGTLVVGGPVDDAHRLRLELRLGKVEAQPLAQSRRHLGHRHHLPAGKRGCGEGGREACKGGWVTMCGGSKGGELLP